MQRLGGPGSGCARAEQGAHYRGAVHAFRTVLAVSSCGVAWRGVDFGLPRRRLSGKSVLISDIVYLCIMSTITKEIKEEHNLLPFTFKPFFYYRYSHKSLKRGCHTRSCLY